MRFLEREDIKVLEWPACSTDFCPIEHLWNILTRRIRARRDNAGNEQYIRAVLEESINLPQHELNN